MGKEVTFMKLEELVAFFRRGGTFDDFCDKQHLDSASEVIEIYAKEPISVESALGFFPIEVSAGQVQFQRDGVLYRSLFDFFYFLDAIGDMKDRSNLTDSEAAHVLFSYAVTDA